MRVTKTDSAPESEVSETKNYISIHVSYIFQQQTPASDG